MEPYLYLVALLLYVGWPVLLVLAVCALRAGIRLVFGGSAEAPEEDDLADFLMMQSDVSDYRRGGRR